MSLVSQKPLFTDLSPLHWTELATAEGWPAFRLKQVWSWVFEKHVFDPEQMLNLPKAMRSRLMELLDWAYEKQLELIETQEAEDGSTKLLFKTSRGAIESVLMRYEGRTSLCVSSQVGCKLACAFCQTGKLGFMRHLSSGEILAQFLWAQKISEKEGRRLSHVVFMGMGEPLDNFEATCHAVRVMTGRGGLHETFPEGYGFSLNPRHVTVSTSGITPKIHELPERIDASLAISLHAPEDDQRQRLMPINRKYPLSQLKAALKHWQQETGRKLTVEYILIDGENCSGKDAKNLAKFLEGIKAKVNLIPFNSHPGMPFKRPSEEAISFFQKELSRRSIPAPVRYSKGLELSAACGQLAAKTQAETHAAPARSRLLGKDPETN